MEIIALYNTKTHRIEEIIPRHSDMILRIYCCGPTVYNYAHIGNFRTFLAQDVLRRLAIAMGYSVKFVRNITDIDDKTIKGAQKSGMTLQEFTQQWIDIFHRDCEKLNILAPDVEPRATEHIREQIEIIQQLIAKRHAYVVTDGSVYFRLSTYANYGKLSGIALQQLRTQQQNSAGCLNQADEYDRDQVCDFALWKAHKPEDGDIFWESPWGRGRPGWHIECSAMSMKYLGEVIDIHGGGIDLCFPHHENEIAQTESITGKNFVEHWFHSAHLQVEGQKMSKSSGNLYILDDLQKKGYDCAAIRYALISSHYRQISNFTFNGLDSAKSALKKLRAKVSNYMQKLGLQCDATYDPRCSVEWRYFKPAVKALKADLNVPKCLGEIFSVLRDICPEDPKFLDELQLLCYILGIREEIFCAENKSTEIPAEITFIADQRSLAKKNKQFDEADRLRILLLEKGWVITDTGTGYTLREV